MTDFENIGLAAGGVVTAFLLIMAGIRKAMTQWAEGDAQATKANAESQLYHNLTEQIDDLRVENRGLKEEISALRGENLELRAEIHKLRFQNTELETCIKNLNSEISDLHEIIKELKIHLKKEFK